MKLAFISLTVVACLWTAIPLCADQQHHKKAHVKQPQPTVQPVPTPAPPPAPLTLQQQPAAPPQVTFQNGQLTITAPNSVLGEILRAVRSRTGASVDVPPNATERVVGRFGPGPARDVLAALLNGSHFNYVMLGSATNPTELDRVILISKPGETEPAAPVSQASVSGPQPPTPGQPPAPMPAGEVASAEPSMTDDEDPSQQDQQVEDETAQEDANTQQQPTNPPPGVRTPEQLLQEMQQRQQQAQQQQQQGGNPQPYPTPPGVAPPGMPPFQPQPQP